MGSQHTVIVIDETDLLIPSRRNFNHHLASNPQTSPDLDRQFSFGSLTFRPQISLRTAESLLTVDIRKMLGQEKAGYTYHYSESSPRISEMLKLMTSVEKCEFKVFQANLRCRTHYPTLEIISRVSFPHLKQLSLIQSLITSIEALAFLDSPLLQTLDLFKNNITALKPLNRSHFPNLKQVDFRKNSVKQWAFGRESFYYSHRIVISNKDHETDNTILDHMDEKFGQDVGWIFAKSQIARRSYIFQGSPFSNHDIKRNGLIDQEKAVNSIRGKYGPRSNFSPRGHIARPITISEEK